MTGAITYYAARIFLTNRSFATEAGIIPPRTLGFTISRWNYGGMHEDLDITNRSVTISAQRFPKEAVYANGRLSFEVALNPGGTWHTYLLYALTDDDKHSAPPHDCIEHHPSSCRAETLADWLRTVAKIQTSNEEFYRLFRRALEDMAALRLPIEGTDHTVFLPAAGLPWTGSATRRFRPIGSIRFLGLTLRR